jgi:hypothetical protein
MSRNTVSIFRSSISKLAHHGRQSVDDELRHAPVGEGAAHASGEPDGAVGLSQRQCAGIRGHLAAVEVAHNLATGEAFKFDLGWATLCRHRLSLLDQKSFWRKNTLPDSARRCPQVR